ncbi:MAG: CRTAC1 family protein [Nannocystaceae bacterium]|nr:CRTAC1 family protein [Nannocystaceae bacterium]
MSPRTLTVLASFVLAACGDTVDATLHGSSGDTLAGSGGGTTTAASVGSTSSGGDGHASAQTSTAAGSDSGGTTTAGASTSTSTGPDGTTSAHGSSSSAGAGGSADSSSSSSGGEPFEPLPLQFTDVTLAAGIDYVQGEYHTSPECLVDQLGPGTNGYCTPERMTGGAAVADIDGDDDLDLFAGRFEDVDVLLRNEGDGSFTDITLGAGLTEVRHSSGAAFADIDNDGDQDLYVLSIGGYGYLLYINDGAGNFVQEAELRGADLTTDVVHTGTSATFGDYDLDGWLDVFVGEWRTTSANGPLPSRARLLHNLGPAQPGVFEDVTDAAGVNMDAVWSQVGWDIEGTFVFAPIFADLDDDGFPELMVSSDFAASRLFWNQGDGTFVDGTVAAGVGLDHNGMGCAVGDHDGDGDLDWYVTSISDDQSPSDNRLYDNQGDGTFVDVAPTLGVGESGWGWGTFFFDPDNDGDLDLFAATGYYYAAYTMDPLRLWRNDGVAPWVDVAAEAGFAGPMQRRGALPLDYDADGDEDVFVVVNAGTPELYRNEHGNQFGWLRVRAVGSSSNRDGIGARVRLWRDEGGPVQLREIGAGGHYDGHGERVAHFGLGPGDGAVAHVEVYWPVSGQTQSFDDVPRNGTLVVEEP